MDSGIRKELSTLADVEYGKFSKSLIPDSKPLIGVRLPLLRTYAKSYVKEHDWRSLVQSKEKDIYFEETMLRGMIMGYGCSKSGDIEEALEMMDSFIPYVDNWSVCDSFCVSFSLFQKHRQKVFEHIKKYIYSDKEFEVRVGLILLLDHFLKCDSAGRKMPRRKSVEISDLGINNIGTDNEIKDMETLDIQTSCKRDENFNISDVGLYTEKILECVDRPFMQGYYAMMAAAWLTAECFVTFPKRTYEFLKDCNLDKVTYNKALQKICESKTPSDEVKNVIKKLKLR